MIRPAEFVDDDDATVQLLAVTEEELPDGNEVKSPAPPSEAVETLPMETKGCGPEYPEGMTLSGMPTDGTSMGGDPMYGEPIETYPGPMGMGDPINMGMPGMGCEAGMGCDGGMNGPCQVCPHCGLYDMPPGYGASMASRGAPRASVASRERDTLRTCSSIFCVPT